MDGNLTEKLALQRMAELRKQRDGKDLKLRWSNEREIRRSLAKVNNLLINGRITPKAANAVYFSANLILQAIKIEKGEN